MRPTQLLAAVVAMSSVTSALTDAFDNIHGMSDVKDVLFGRQDNQDQKDSSSQAPQSSQAPSSNQPTRTQSSNDNKDDNKASQTDKPTGSAKASGSQVTGKPKGTSFDPRLPAGGLTMVTPNVMQGDQLYKVGNYITFAWNYTSVSVPPSAVDVMVSCTANQATYTIAVNMSAEQTKVVWDTKNTPAGQKPFLTDKYTLLIYDSELSFTAAPRPGYFAAFSSLTFGMYTPEKYVPWNDFECANCIKNGASERMTINVLLITSGTTIASLLYFAHNFGLW